MKCAICEVRKPRRYCPGIRAEICSICCGTERENTVNCPFDCVYLREARSREKPNELDNEALAKIPFAEIRVPDNYLREHEAAAQMVLEAVLSSVLSASGAIDHDVREALEALIRTYKTLQSGLVYETRPDNPIAGGMYQTIQAAVEEGRKKIAANTGVSVRDADVMASLLMLQRQLYHYDNGRKRGRAFIDHLREFFGERDAAIQTASPLIV